MSPGAGILELRHSGEMHGWDADMLGLKEKQFVSDVRKNMVLRMAEDDPIAANSYLEAHANQMTREDRLSLKASLKTPLLAAKGTANAAERLAGVSNRAAIDDRSANEAPAPQYSNDKPASPIDIAKRFMGSTEAKDSAAIHDFIKRSAGLDVDPRVTPWCAAFVNAVLGAEGVKGTGKLNARSFLNFGMKTHNPKPGDIVILSRDNDPAKGHVGFSEATTGTATC